MAESRLAPSGGMPGVVSRAVSAWIEIIEMWCATTSCSSRAILARSPRAACSSRLPARYSSDARRAADSARERAVLPTIPATVVSVSRTATAALVAADRSQGNGQEDRKGEEQQQPTRWGRMPGDQVEHHDERDGSRRRWGRIPRQRQRVRQRHGRCHRHQVGPDERQRSGGQQAEQEAKVGGPSSTSPRSPPRTGSAGPLPTAPPVTWIRASSASTTAPVTGSSAAPVSRRPAASARLRGDVAWLTPPLSPSCRPVASPGTVVSRPPRGGRRDSRQDGSPA